MARLEGKVAIVTGAGRGLGRGVARRLAREKATVIVAEIDEGTGAATAEEITRDYGVPAIFRHTDIGNETDAKAMVEDSFNQLNRVDILVNAAQGFTPIAPIEEKTTAMYDYSYRTGLLGSLWAMQAAMPYMRAQGGGRIVNFCSLNGVAGEVLFSDYNATKEAIRGLTRSAAREWGRFGIRVNCIAPAGLSPAHIAYEAANPNFAKRLRQAIALGYVGDPEEDIGGVALMLCCDDSRFVTGMTIFADGGLHLTPLSSFHIDEWDANRTEHNPAHKDAPTGIRSDE